ncbi:MAG: ArsI/CadI family heavy metal resistance metalloenzyme [Cyanobacteria bacterium J06642_2]
MSRLQLALNVSNMDEAVAFYSRMFGVEPAKRRPGYANFTVPEPPLKLVLMEKPGAGGTLNHLGVEVDTTERVSAERDRLLSVGLNPSSADLVTCCYAKQSKTYVSDTDGLAWEIYAVLGDSVEHSGDRDNRPVPRCCTY